MGKFNSDAEYLDSWRSLIKGMLAGNEAVAQQWDELEKRSEVSDSLRIPAIAARLGLLSWEHFALTLAFCAEADPELRRLMGDFPDFAMATRLYEAYRGPLDLYVLRSSLRLDTLFGKDWRTGGLRLTEAAFQILCGFSPDLPGCRYVDCASIPQSLDSGFDPEELEKCMEYALKGNPVVVALTGPEGCGKAFYVRKAAEKFQTPLFEIEADKLPADSGVLSVLFGDICILLQAHFSAVCLRHYTPSLKEYLPRLLEVSPFLAVTSTESVELPDLGGGTLVDSLSAPPLTYRGRRDAWLHYLERFGAAVDFDIGRISNQYRLSIGGIESAVKAFALRQRAGLACAEADLRKIIERNSFTGVKSGLARMTAPGFCWDDLILPERTVLRLREICERIRFADKVMDEWGFAKKYPYGTGLSVLFYGSPGTGKTMAAHVIANELQIPLMHVVFSNMIDKYIGETEKHIGELFAHARRTGAALFFDEADALFAKRSEVSDSTDRYANAQTACLLEEIEEYDGLVILSTNMLSNFDDAFRRRIRYFLHFFHPDKQDRRRIWESSFPAGARLAPDVDMEVLAERELSAGSIKNIVLTSAYLAAADGGEIRMADIASAFLLEKMKESHAGNESVTDDWI